MINDLEKLLIGALTVLIPIALYTVTYLASFSHAFSLSTMGLASIAELTAALYLLKRR